MKKAFQIVCLLTGFLPAACWSQGVITNEAGQRVVVFPDGRWQYFQGDTLPTDAPSKTERLFAPGAVDSAENHQRVLESKAIENSLTLKLIQKRLEIAALQTEMTGAKEELAGTQKAVEDLEMQLKAAKERTAFLARIQFLPTETFQRKMEEWNLAVASKTKTALKKNRERTDGADLKTSRSGYGIGEDILNLPPVPPCKTGIKGTDPNTNQERKDTGPMLFFSQTDVAIEKEYKNREFITCSGTLTGLSGGLRFLNLEISVATPNAPQIFGALPRGEFIEIKMLSGEIIRLFNSLPNSAKWQPGLEVFVYKSQYSLGFREEKLLREGEIDSVTVRWSKVQETYPVYEPDFFSRQFECLESI
ncbi:MAG: hypothetical protein HY842_11530 [Bacteroidetes bacterium]|nr:hypothetical protein [Bacteroidota bacterium]